MRKISEAKILFVTRVIPIGNSTGARSYVLSFLSYLKSNGFNIELACIDSSPGGRSPILILPAALKNFCGLSFRDQTRFNRIVFRLKSFKDLMAMPLGIAYQMLSEKKRHIFVDWSSALVSRFLKRTGNGSAAVEYMPSIKNHPATPEECQFVRKRIDKFKPDIVIVNYAWLAKVFDGVNLGPPILKIVLAHDVIHQRFANAEKAGIQWGDYSWTSENEKSLLSKADVILTIQKEDCIAIQQLLPNSNVFCMPMAAQPNKQYLPQIRGRCLFVGSKGYASGHSLQWFLDKVWPRIRIAAPHSHLHVCGTVCNEIKGNYDRVYFLGRVENLAPEYDQAEVCLAPLLFGTGLKIKVIEALSFGRACVATDFGLQGLDDLSGKAILRANSAEEFAEAILTLLANKSIRRQLEKEAHRYIRENFPPEKVYQPVIDLIHQHMFANTA
jgi:glycosyltransferase involved in cell wall biosynthesis